MFPRLVTVKVKDESLNDLLMSLRLRILVIEVANKIRLGKQSVILAMPSGSSGIP